MVGGATRLVLMREHNYWLRNKQSAESDKTNNDDWN